MDARGESAVTPVIGTLLVLAITVAGIAVTLFLGAPVIQHLQDQAALETMVGQFQEVRHATNSMSVVDTARNPGLSLPSGSVALGSGNHVLVTASYDSQCDLHLTNWADFDPVLTVVLSTCRVILQEPSGACNLALGSVDACFEVFSYDGSTATAVPVVSASAVSITVNANLDPNQDYLIRMTNGRAAPSTVVYAQAWLMHTDRLAWTNGQVSAFYEAGAVFGKSGGSTYLVASPALSESTGPLFLRWSSFQDSISGALSGGGSHSVAITLDEGLVRTDVLNAKVVRIAFGGSDASSWCNAIMIRNTLQALPAANSYVDDALGIPVGVPGTSCTAQPGTNVLSNTDDVYGVRYPSTPTLTTTAFPFTLTQPILNAHLQV